MNRATMKADHNVRFVDIPCHLTVTLVDGEPADLMVTLVCGRAMLRVDAMSAEALGKFVRGTLAAHLRENVPAGSGE